MGSYDVKTSEGEELRSFMQALLEDVQALERMIEEGLIESGIRRIGAEQEMFLVDRSWHPANVADAVLKRLEGNFTPELARFNLEANASPQVLAGGCLSALDAELTAQVALAREAADAEGVRVLLCGILPTLNKADLTLEAMAANPRYHMLNRVMTEMRGGEFSTLIKGLDELSVKHDNVMLEACNTSFQIHFQVAPDEFAKLYNLAQVVTGPVLAASVNSPVFLQHRLWHETRVALFQQSLDSRNTSQQKRGGRQRVTFGDRWVEHSVLDIIREDVSRFRVLLATDLGEPSLEMLDRGEIPPLKALCLHNGTIYRWNRPCYGIGGGKPHLRIENRVLPAGPTIRDEVANAAFHFGLMIALGEEVSDVTEAMSFDDAKGNFMAAARYGLHAQLQWLNGRSGSARELILKELLPLARRGLEEKAIEAEDIDLYLGVIQERVEAGRTGAQWALDSLAGMQKQGRGTPDSRHRVLTRAMYENQLEDRPVHTWPLASLDEGSWRDSVRRVDQVMTRDVFTVQPEDVIDLAASLMDWEHLHRVPVEDDDGRLVGLLSQRALLRVLATGRRAGDRAVAVKEVMSTDVVTIGRDASTLEAIEKMRERKVGCLLVVDDERLVGIITEHDFIQASRHLLEDYLRES